MASMNIEMRLNLVDTASAPVKAFMSTLEALEQAVSGVASKLAGLSAGMDALGASLGLIKSNSAAAASELGAVGAQANTAAGETARLETTMAALSLSLERIVGQLGVTTAGFARMGSAAAAASAEANAAMDGVGTGAQGAGTHVNALAASIRGMSELWAAFKIEKGLKSSIEQAAEYERTDNRLRNMNLSPAESEAIHKSVRQTGRDFHQFDQNELLEMAIDLRNATGSAHEAAEGLKGFAQSVFAINLSMPSGKKLDEQGTLNFAKFLEGRGVTMDPAAMAAQQDLVTKIVAATQGRVNPNNLFGNLTYAKGGLGRTMDDQALVTFAAMIEQDTRGGGTGGTVGTMLTSFVNSITKANAITTKNRDEWLKLGLVDPDKVNINENTNRVTSIQAGAIAGTEIAGKNFKRWVDEYLRPALVAAGVNMDDITEIKAKTDVLFPNRNASEAAFQLLSKKDLIEKDSDNITKTAGKDQQVANGEKLSAANWERFHKTINDLAIAIGTTLLPVLNPLLEGFTKILEVLGHLSQDHPVFGFIIGLAGGLGSISLMIAGATRLFGPLGTVLGVTAESFGGFGAVVRTVGGFIAAAIPMILKWLLRLAGPIGVVLLIWDAGLGDWISKLEVFGHSVGDWASSLSDKVATSFRNMWVRTKEYFGFLSKDAADAQIEANNRSSTQKQGKLGFGPKPVSAAQTGGASGDWDRGEEVSPAARAVEEKIKREKAIAKQLADNKEESTGLLGSGKKRGRFANYDASLDDAKNDLRLEEDGLARHMKAEDELYKANKISINEYYDDKLATMRKSVDAQIKELEREKAAYKRQGDKAGVNRAETEITLRKRDRDDNEKSVEVQREKDLNALKERGLQLEAQQLQAEGKRNQAALAREVQRLEKDKKEYLLNGDTEHAKLAQQAIDTAKLTAAWEAYGDAVKKVHEETQTKEAAVDAQVKSGNLTKFAAEQKIFALRQQEARQLDELIAKERALIQASDAPQAVKDQRLKTLDLAKTKNDSVLSEMNPELMRAKDTLDGSLQGGFENFFNSVISGSKSGANAFKEFGESIKSTFTKLISEQLGKSLFKSLFGEGGIGSGGGMLGDLFSGLFGGKSSGSGASGAAAGGGSGGGFLDAVGNFFSGMFHLDVGTDNVPQDMIAQIHQGEMVVPKYDAERLRSLKPGEQQSAPPPVTLQIHPDAIHMKLSDWLDGELARQMAHR